MNKIQDKIVHADFKKIARRFIAAAIVFVVAGAAAGGLILKPQIQDAYALHQNKDKIVKQVEQAQGSNEKSDKYKQDADHEKEHEVDWEDVYKDQITPPSTGAFVGLGVLGAIGLAFGIVYWLLIAAWLPFDKEICHVAYFCIWLCVFRRDHSDPGEVRDPADGFDGGDGDPNHRSSGVFVAHGFYRGFTGSDFKYRRENAPVFSAVRSRDRRKLALLL